MTKYLALQDLSEFIYTFGESQKEAKGAEVLLNRRILEKISK